MMDPWFLLPFGAGCCSLGAFAVVVAQAIGRRRTRPPLHRASLPLRLCFRSRFVSAFSDEPVQRGRNDGGQILEAGGCPIAAYLERLERLGFDPARARFQIAGDPAWYYPYRWRTMTRLAPGWAYSDDRAAAARANQRYIHEWGDPTE